MRAYVITWNTFSFSFSFLSFFVLGVGDKNVSLYVSFSFWANEENVLRLAVESYADNQTDNISKQFRTAERYSQAATFCKRRQNEALKLYRHSERNSPFAFLPNARGLFLYLGGFILF